MFSRAEVITSLRPLDLLEIIQWPTTLASLPTPHLLPYHAESYKVALIAIFSPINQPPMSSRKEQCFKACAALTALLDSHNVPHAFAGGFLTVALGAEPREIEVGPFFLRRIGRIYLLALQEIYCVAPGFRAVRQACTDNEILTATPAPWSGRCVYCTPSLLPFLIRISIDCM